MFIPSCLCRCLWCRLFSFGLGSLFSSQFGNSSFHNFVVLFTCFVGVIMTHRAPSLLIMFTQIFYLIHCQLLLQLFSSTFISLFILVNRKSDRYVHPISFDFKFSFFIKCPCFVFKYKFCCYMCAKFNTNPA